MNKKKFKERLQRNIAKQKQLKKEEAKRIEMELEVLNKVILESIIFTLAISEDGLENIPLLIMNEHREACMKLEALIKDGYLEQLIEILNLDREHILNLIEMYQNKS